MARSEDAQGAQSWRSSAPEEAATRRLCAGFCRAARRRGAEPRAPNGAARPSAAYRGAGGERALPRAKRRFALLCPVGGKAVKELRPSARQSTDTGSGAPSAERLAPGAEIFTLSDTGGQRAGSGRCALGDSGRPTGLRARLVALLPPVAEGREKRGPVSVDCRAIWAQISLAGLAANGAGRARCASWAPPFSRLSHRGPHKAQRGALRCFALEARRRDGARRGKTLNRSLVAAASSGAAERQLCAPCAESGGGHAGRVTLPRSAPSTRH